jgi:signal-transduction protein with cAMP-binding, CBS, and nucleotidyltransferase domain
MLIREILKNKGSFVFTAKENEPICNIVQIFREKKIGSFMVNNDSGEIVGIVTEKDLIKCFCGEDVLKELKIKDIMTKYEDLIIAAEEDDIQYAMSMMTKNRIKHIPIFREQELVGLLSIGDLIKAQLVQSEHISKTYLDHIKGKTPQPDNQEF